MDTRLPLSTLLSQALVAFTIEFDNEFEHQMPHTTTSGPAAHSGLGPWLVSQAMWSNFMQFVPSDGTPLRELEERGRVTNLKGLERWGYIVVDRDGADSVVRLTPNGRSAQEVWRPLAGVIEARWEARFGVDEIGRLRESLRSSVRRQPDSTWLHYLPVVAHDMFARIPDIESRTPDAGFDLAALFSQVLLAFTIEFERESKVSLPIGANALRVLDENGVRVRDLPRLTGVSKEAISVSLGVLEKSRYVVIEPDPTASRTKLARLTPKGREGQDAFRRLLRVVDERREARFGRDGIGSLREILEPLVGSADAKTSPLFRGLEPYPDGWRASSTKPDTLPHYPMVLHRGGFPDGS